MIGEKTFRAWPHSQVVDLFYGGVLKRVDRMEALARAVVAWSYAHEEQGIAMKDMNAVVVLGEYIERECLAVRALEGRVCGGPAMPDSGDAAPFLASLHPEAVGKPDTTGPAVTD